jgi:tRNA 5-methylaminomethyl-2-thiouridine biosynthesis bifunctional protein
MQTTASFLGDWSGHAGWRVLDTHFGKGQTFFNTWLGWTRDADRPRVLHYVALCPAPPSAKALIESCGDNADMLSLAHALADSWFGLLSGFHRFSLAEGQVILTLCVGDALNSLRQQSFLADAVILSFPAEASDGDFELGSLWSIKALARCCRRGTTLYGHESAPKEQNELRRHLTQCGFDIADKNTDATYEHRVRLKAVFAPTWAVKKTRQTDLLSAFPVQRCAVIGAGLAGASVAASLARRGWKVEVLDQATQPAAGASGLPAGLVVPHVSSDDCTLSRLSRAGVRLMQQEARQHLKEGLQWSASGVLERQIDDTPQLPASWTKAGNDWTVPSSDNPTCSLAMKPGQSGLWHHRGAWLKPAELVSAWLRTAGVSFQGNAKVNNLRQTDGVWYLLDKTGRVLGAAERVVFANACGAQTLLSKLQQTEPDIGINLRHLPTMQGMRGLLSWGMHTNSCATGEAFPPFPVNGSGSLIPQVPIDTGYAWLMGSSYQPENQTERSDKDNHAINFQHLQQLLPEMATGLSATFASDAIKTWRGTRCVSADRMPLVGPLDGGNQPGLWICTGLGSRGLSFSVLCAELLAARWGCEPLPVESNLAKALQALRA